jgi:hypothetical protein
MASPMPANALLRPAENPQTRFGGIAAPAGPQLPMNALQMPPPAAPAANPLVAPTPGPMAPGIQEPQRNPAGIEHRVSTRIPTSTKLAYDPHERADLSIGRGAMIPEGLGAHHMREGHEQARSNVAEAMQKHADLIRNEYPFIDTGGLTHGGVLERFIEHAHDNIVDLWQRVRNEPWRDRAADWYRGANRIAKDMGDRFGVSHRQASAAIATLSPQKDWDQNVSLAERVMNTHANHQDTKVTPQMRDFMQKMVDARTDKTRAALDQYVSGGTHQKTGEVYRPIEVGMSYRDLAHAKQKALFIRAHDEMHSPDRGYDIISPSGERIRARIGEGGNAKDATAAWGGTDEIANAVRALERDHLPTISRALGAKHKVRNFYNNIIAPDAAAFLQPHHGDITADTHAINVGMLFPMGGQHRMVAQGLGTGGNIASPAFTGAHGLYGLHADAYRRAAQTISKQEGRQYLPREVQSVVWEAIRGLWRKEHKAVDSQTGMPTHEVGKVAHGAAYAVRHGFMPAQMARDAVVQAAGGIRAPNWHTRRAVVEEV